MQDEQSNSAAGSSNEQQEDHAMGRSGTEATKVTQAGIDSIRARSDTSAAFSQSSHLPSSALVVWLIA